MLTVSSVDMSGFNAGMRGLANIGIPMSKVVKKETGELIKTLVRQSPAANAKKIKDDVMRRFELQSSAVKPEFDGMKTSSGMNWISVNKNYLVGVAPDLDMRKATPDELKSVMYSITKKGRIRKEFKHPRKLQKVLLLQRIVSKAATVKKLALQKAGNRGRLKAGWLSAVVGGVITLAGGSLPPDWVKKHATPGKMKGRHESGLQNQNFPSFTIANFAKGVRNGATLRTVNLALKIRAKAMAANAATYFKGKKKLSDYAKGI